MKTIKTVEVTPIVLPDILPDNSELQQGNIYISQKYKTASHKCLCGCGNLVITPFNTTGWQYIIDPFNRLSITPSIGNYNLSCQSHYVITKNKANFL